MILGSSSTEGKTVGILSRLRKRKNPDTPLDLVLCLHGKSYDLSNGKIGEVGMVEKILL